MEDVLYEYSDTPDDLLAAFRIPSVERPSWAPGVDVTRTDTTLMVEKGWRKFAVTATASFVDGLHEHFSGALSRDSLVRRIDEEDRTALDWVTRQFTWAGFVQDSGAPPGPDLTTGVNLIDGLYDRIATSSASIQTLRSAASFFEGSAPLSVAHGWLLENFHYTASAARHISPVIENAVTQEERNAWTVFRDDEATHWRIYNACFRELGWSFESARAIAPLPSTVRFVDYLQGLAAESQYAYAAAMMLIEEPPNCGEIFSDPLYATLHRTYGFSEYALRALWWHATENERSGHSLLGAAVIASRARFDQAQITRLNAAIDGLVERLCDWYREIEEVYSSSVGSERLARARASALP